MKILSIILMISISAVSEIVVLYAITFALHMSVADAVTIPEYRFLGILLSKTLGVAICNIVRVRFKLKQSEIKLAYLGLFAFLFANAVLIVFLLFRMTYALQDAYFNDLSVVASFALFASVFFRCIFTSTSRNKTRSSAIRSRLSSKCAFSFSIWMKPSSAKTSCAPCATI